MRTQIHRKIEEMKDPNYNKLDILTVLLRDDVFMNKPEMLVDEFCLFMVAGTQTTSFMIGNVLMHLTRNPDIKRKVLTEIAGISKDSRLPNGDIDWMKALDYENLTKFEYLY